ncbi:hypothetical protein AB0K00_09370 [Dactylosporangium sp. NPDC049525]|uniref:hypothetical protein n=1 Tax=Dactylosporangium sp. NPDC049525 TaxID=3154730 RepID=UPI00342067EF
MTALRPPINRQINAQRVVTHCFGSGDFLPASDIFANAGQTGARKVVLSRTG